MVSGPKIELYVTETRFPRILQDQLNSYFEILRDLLISYELPVFTRRAKRRTIHHAKFYFFDVGVYQSLRPTGILDSSEEVEGTALETLFFQSIRAINDYYNLNYKLYYWRTVSGLEVDFVLYGESGFHAFEIKRKPQVSKNDLKGLLAFKDEYPEATFHLVYGGSTYLHYDDVQVIPIVECLKKIPDLLRS